MQDSVIYEQTSRFRRMAIYRIKITAILPITTSISQKTMYRSPTSARINWFRQFH
jgi:hypothetical protein